MTPLAPLRRLDSVLFACGEAHHLAVLRLGIAVVAILRLATWPYAELAGTPATMFRPPALMEWADGYPSAQVLLALQVTGCFAALWAIIASLRSGSACIPLAIAWLVFLVLGGYKTSTGKVLHNDLLLLLAAAPVVLCRARARFGDRTTSFEYGWPPQAALTTVAIVYFVCGVQKLRHSGLDWVFSDNMQWMLASGLSSGRAPTEVIAATIVSHPTLSFASGAALIGLELSFPAVLLWPRLRRSYAAGAVLLHTLTWLTLGLDYWAWSLTAVLVLSLGASSARSGYTHPLRPGHLSKGRRWWAGSCLP